MKGYFLVRGDKTSCGGKILAGSSNFRLNGYERICEGDPVSCGKDGNTYKVSGGLDHFTYRGRRLAGTLDSFSGCPCRSRLLHSIDSATYESATSSMRSSGAATSGLLSTSSSASTKSSLASPLVTHPPSALPTAPMLATATCPHPDRMEELASYIADEMNRNIHHPSVLRMSELNAYDAVDETRKYFDQPFYLTMGHAPDFNAIELAKKAEAFALWTERVGQNRPWDHKPKFLRKYNGIAWHKHGRYNYFHDIWSNIHYGYIGVAAGFSESILLDGAGLEQIGSDLVRKVAEWENRSGPRKSANVEGFRAWDDVADRLSIMIGIKLYGVHKGNVVDPALIMTEVLSIDPADWGRDGARLHECFRR